VVATDDFDCYLRVSRLLVGYISRSDHIREHTLTGLAKHRKLTVQNLTNINFYLRRKKGKFALKKKYHKY
jgi:hypothetical protein